MLLSLLIVWGSTLLVPSIVGQKRCKNCKQSCCKFQSSSSIFQLLTTCFQLQIPRLKREGPCGPLWRPHPRVCKVQHLQKQNLQRKQQQHNRPKICSIFEEDMSAKRRRQQLASIWCYSCESWHCILHEFAAQKGSSPFWSRAVQGKRHRKWQIGATI